MYAWLNYIINNNKKVILFCDIIFSILHCIVFILTSPRVEQGWNMAPVDDAYNYPDRWISSRYRFCWRSWKTCCLKRKSESILLIISSLSLTDNIFCSSHCRVLEKLCICYYFPNSMCVTWMTPSCFCLSMNDSKRENIGDLVELMD